MLAGTNPQGLLDVYKKIQQEDWIQVRTHPQFLNKGWSEQCVPTVEESQCCDWEEVAKARGRRLESSRAPLVV